LANASGLKSAKELAIAAPFAIIHRCVFMKSMVLLPGSSFKSRFGFMCLYGRQEGKIGLFDKGGRILRIIRSVTQG
jgi:hypothetical protein